MNTIYRPAKEEDIEIIRDLLESHRLPAESLGTGITDFYLALENNDDVGVAGFEYYGDDVLLRSVVVPSKKQHLGIGSGLVDWMIALAGRQGKKRIILLTETAIKFFAKRGFASVERSLITNDAMKRSSQFGGCCCSSAACMLMNIEKENR